MGGGGGGGLGDNVERGGAFEILSLLPHQLFCRVSASPVSQRRCKEHQLYLYDRHLCFQGSQSDSDTLHRDGFDPTCSPSDSGR